MKINVSAISAFQDNYIWLISNDGHAVVVDPGDAVPVLACLKQQHLSLDAILITHHHADHIGGVLALLAEHPDALVYAPKKEKYDFPHIAVEESLSIQLKHLNLHLEVFEVPGHTLGHVAYYGANSLFCGDTLFGAGCGRLFEGTPAQMFASLQKIAQLPKETAVYCAHEYTEHNLQFASTLEPNNQLLLQRIAETKTTRKAGKPSLPSNVGLELETNPFLRCHSQEIADSIAHKAGLKTKDSLEIFTAIRQLRNHF